MKRTIWWLTSTVLTVLIAAEVTANEQQADQAGDSQPRPDTSAVPMDTITFADGGSTLIEIGGEGPGIIFVSRGSWEHAEMAERLREWYTVVRYVPRWLGAQGTPLPKDANRKSTVGDQLPEANQYPFNMNRWPGEVLVSDLHAVADEAGLGTFVLAGYSGTGRFADSLSGLSERMVGVMIGGIGIAEGYQYWMGFSEANRDAKIQDDPDLAFQQHMMALEFDYLDHRDHGAAFKKLPGPKIAWYGGIDGDPYTLMALQFRGARIAERMRRQTAFLESVGFTVIEMEGEDHNGVFVDTDGSVTNKLHEALVTQGWK